MSCVTLIAHTTNSPLTNTAVRPSSLEASCSSPGSESALSLLDDRFAAAWESWGDFNARSRRRRKGMATYRLVRYAGDFVVLVPGTRRMRAPGPTAGAQLTRSPGLWTHV
jgi:hypothetical protein